MNVSEVFILLSKIVTEFMSKVVNCKYSNKTFEKRSLFQKLYRYDR